MPSLHSSTLPPPSLRLYRHYPISALSRVLSRVLNHVLSRVLGLVLRTRWEHWNVDAHAPRARGLVLIEGEEEGVLELFVLPLQLDDCDVPLLCGGWGLGFRV
jgi:hypothetical protein